MDLYIILCSGAAGAAIGLLLGYLWRGYEDSHVWRIQEEERQHYTQGAAYDAMEEPTTDYDAEAVRKLLSW